MTHFVGSDRGVNPIIGIVLLIGVAVILSAAIGTFLIGFSSELSGGAQGAVQTSSVQPHETDGFVTIAGVSMERADRIAVEATVTSENGTLDDGENSVRSIEKTIEDPDESVTFQQYSPDPGDVALEIVAVAHHGDDSARILRTEVTI